MNADTVPGDPDLGLCMDSVHASSLTPQEMQSYDTGGCRAAFGGDADGENLCPRLAYASVRCQCYYRGKGLCLYLNTFSLRFIGVLGCTVPDFCMYDYCRSA